jgi:hypothetical protein
MSVSEIGPFPPIDALREDEGDLAGMMLDELYTREHFEQQVRGCLHQKLGVAVQQEDWSIAAALLQAFVDCWPLGAMVDSARQRWATEAHGDALPVLGRAANLLTLAHGWEPMGAGPWPMPDRDWIQAHEQTARGAFKPWELPPVTTVKADQIVTRRADLVRQLVGGDVHAVIVDGTPIQSPAVALALGEFRMEGLAQVAVDTYGLAGLLAPGAGTFSGCLRPVADASHDGPLRAMCDGILLPGPVRALREGTPRTVGWLLWDAPIAPIPVAPTAVAVLQGFEDTTSLQKVAQTLGAPLEIVERIVKQLVSAGAMAGEVSE